jgi:hypothetical protein
MPAAPTNEPTQDPWGVSDRISVDAPERVGIPAPRANAARPNRTAAQQARIQRLARSSARLEANASWPTARAWTLAGVGGRTAAAGILVGLGFEDLHMHSLYLSPTTNWDQWNAALHTADETGSLYIILILSAILTTQAWVRTRAYLAKCPGVAPHPLQATKEIYRLQRVPAYWPPVPEGVESWTRRIPWRVPSSITAVFLLLLLAEDALDRWILTAPGSYEVSAVIKFAAAAVALTGAALDYTRLRAYSRWPGRP